MTPLLGSVPADGLALLLCPQLSFGEGRRDAKNEKRDNDLGRRVECEGQDRRNGDDGQDRQSKAVVGAQAVQISQEQDPVVHDVAY